MVRDSTSGSEAPLAERARDVGTLVSAGVQMLRERLWSVISFYRPVRVMIIPCVNCWRSRTFSRKPNNNAPSVP